MDTPIVLAFSLKSSPTSRTIRSAVLKDYFSKLTSNVEVLYPTQIQGGLLLCKSRRTEEKILKMYHVLFNGSTIHFTPIPRQLFRPVKCSIDAQMMQSAQVGESIQQCVPFLHASAGKIQINPDGSVVLEGNIFILNAIHSFVANKVSKQLHAQSNSALEALVMSSGPVSVKVMIGNLLEQVVEGIVIPMNDKYKIHKAFHRQIQMMGGTTLLNYVKELTTKGTRTYEGEVIVFPNRQLKTPTKAFIIFVVPRLSNSDVFKDKAGIDSFQPAYELMLYRALQAIDQNNITTLAMPVLEPSVRTTNDRRYANEMTVRAMVSSIRQFSQTVSTKLKRIIIVDHQVQIKRVNRRVIKYQRQNQAKNPSSNNIDFDVDDGVSFATIFGVPKLPEVNLSTSESDDELEPEEYQLPYTDHARI